MFDENWLEQKKVLGLGRKLGLYRQLGGKTGQQYREWMDSAAIVFPRGLHFHIQVSLFIITRSNIQLVETVYLLRLRWIFVRSGKITLRMSFGLFFISAWSGRRLPISLQQKAWVFTRQAGRVCCCSPLWTRKKTNLRHRKVLCNGHWC